METLTLRRKTLASGRVDLIRAMANLTGDPDNLANFQTNENGSAALDAVHDYESVIDSILEGDLRVYLSETEETHLKWESFLQTYFFVLILITTIGYGNLAPTTIWGRIFCINYALIGIPVMLIFITQVGKRLARFSTCVYLRFFGNRTGWRYFTSEKDPSYIQKMMGTSASISTVVIVLFSYMAIGAALFDVTEQWGFINSFYFCFISLTTVGFGDLVPLPIGPGNKWGPVLIILRTIYSLCGLAITATAIQLVQSHYEEIWIKAEVKRSLREKEKMEDIRCGCEDVKLPSVSN